MLEQYKQKILQVIDGCDMYQDIEIKGNIMEVFLRANTKKFDKSQYEEWYRFIENTHVNNKDYSMEFHTDGGGYEYWSNQEYSNWVTIYTNVKHIKDDNLEAFLNDLYDFINKYKKIEGIVIGFKNNSINNMRMLKESKYK